MKAAEGTPIAERWRATYNAGRDRVLIEELSAAEERERVLREAPVSHAIAGLLCNLAQILDVVKGEWAESWSEWDQQQRDAITAALTAYYAALATPAKVTE